MLWVFSLTGRLANALDILSRWGTTDSLLGVPIFALCPTLVESLHGLLPQVPSVWSRPAAGTNLLQEQQAPAYHTDASGGSSLSSKLDLMVHPGPWAAGATVTWGGSVAMGAASHVLSSRWQDSGEAPNQDPPYLLCLWLSGHCAGCCIPLHATHSTGL